MKFDVPEDVEFRRLATGSNEQCSFCSETAGNVARVFDENDVNVKNIYFCWNHWGEYLQQVFGGYVMRGGMVNGRSR